MSEETKEDADVAMVRGHVNALSEHFDSVQIFCTRYENDKDGTISVQLGAGNYHARNGHIRDWLIKEEEATRIGVRADTE